MKIFDDTLTRLERSLDTRLIRHGVLAGNVANIDTPGYKPKDIDFDSVMASLPSEGGGALGRTDEGHMDANGTMGRAARGDGGLDPSEVRIIEVSGGSPSLDGNGVDIDRAMSTVAENAIQYGAAAKAATKKLAILRYAASDGQG